MDRVHCSGLRFLLKQAPHAWSIDLHRRVSRQVVHEPPVHRDVVASTCCAGAATTPHCLVLARPGQAGSRRRGPRRPAGRAPRRPRSLPPPGGAARHARSPRKDLEAAADDRAIGAAAQEKEVVLVDHAKIGRADPVRLDARSRTSSRPSSFGARTCASSASTMRISQPGNLRPTVPSFFRPNSL